MKPIYTKPYDDGSTGNYLCTCATCHEVFIGHKRDPWCGRKTCTKTKDEISIRTSLTPEQENGLAKIVDEQDAVRKWNADSARSQKRIGK